VSSPDGFWFRGLVLKLGNEKLGSGEALTKGNQAQVQRQRYAIGNYLTSPANGAPSLE
jgi:hypothetical protein